MKEYEVKKKIDNEYRKRHKIVDTMFFIIFIIYCFILFKSIVITHDEAQHNLINILNNNFTEYDIVDVQGKECTKDDIEFTEFYVVSDDTLYKCEYTISSDELRMQKISDATIILRGKKDE